MFLEGKDFQLKEAIEKILDNIEYYTLDIGSKNYFIQERII